MGNPLVESADLSVGALLHSEWWPHPLCSIQSHTSRSNVKLYALKQTVSAAVYYTYKM